MNVAALLSLIAACAALTANPSPKSAGEGHADYYDVVFFADSRPVIIRFHVEIDTQRLSDAWNANAIKVFRYLDRDQNGSLDSAELARSEVLAARAGPGMLILRGLAFLLGANKTESAPAEAPLTLSDFVGRLRARQSEFQLVVETADDRSQDRLFAILDEDSNGQISFDERAGALARLMKLDLDDDEILSQQELQEQPYPSFETVFLRAAGSQRARPKVSNGAARFVLNGDAAARSEIVERWMREYGHDGLYAVEQESPLARVLDPGTKVDVAALSEILGEPPVDAEMEALVGKKRQPDLGRIVFVTPDRRALPKKTKNLTFSSKNGSRTIETATEKVEIVVAKDASSEDLGREYKEAFAQAGTDKNKYLDAQEFEQSGAFTDGFAALDANGDGKIFEDEFTAWLSQQVAAAASHVVLTAQDEGRQLFPAFDKNGDGRLSVRELKAGLDNLFVRDVNRDHILAESELPRQFRLTLGTREFKPMMSSFAISFVGTSVPQRQSISGPEWYRNMDQNQDGDVSRREFLGTDAAFKKLDKNHDGFIDGKEAAAAH